MQLSKFIVKNYRSINDATISDITKYCVIVGPNNSGKSNLLRALMIALAVATEGDFQRGIRRRAISSYAYHYEGQSYVWERDIPRSMKNNEDATTVFKLTFNFSEKEKAEFSQKIGINLSKSLQMKFSLGKSRKYEYSIIMPGRAKAPMEKKMAEIGLFIRSKLDYQYIPCVRTSEFTSDYFTQLLSKELQGLESNPEFQELYQKIRSLQKPILLSLEDRLTNAMKTFLPNVKRAQIDMDYLLSDSMVGIEKFRLRRTPINVDDGNLTSLDDKGDGVKSLAAISLVQSLSFENATNKSLILCIEEPESHLHPEAIHSLRNVILELTEKAKVQVVISTHSPLLIDRDNPSHNVQIDDSHKVHPCSSISEIRNLLGIRLTDNLDGVKRVVLVEGECDKKILSRLCSSLNPNLDELIKNGTLEFVAVGSATKMDYQIRLYNSLLIPSIVMLDSDQCGIQTHKSLIDSKLKKNDEVMILKIPGMRECEIEDFVDFNAYSFKLQAQFNIWLDPDRFKNKNKPWSDRIKIEADCAPILYDAEIEKQIKIMITELVVERGLEVIPDYLRKQIKGIADSIAQFCKICS
nr:AAA family ATPase [uncultured Sphaerochaeta sp.]